MSRYYDMTVQVNGLKSKEQGEIAEAAVTEEWNTGYTFLDPSEEMEPGNWKLVTGGQGNLCGGESEEEFAGRVAKAVWEATGCYVPIEVTATYLEDLPCETYCLGEEEFDVYLKNKEEPA